jgi:protein-S-isoprenylcysteine O-methyltransferase Ste14
MRNATRQDMLLFALPAALPYIAGLVISARDLVRQQDRLFVLSVLSIVGLALIIIGLTVLFVSAATLRRCYSSSLVIWEDHRPITHGVYRFTRHPIYLGGIMVCVGVPVYASSLLGFLMMLALIPLILNRIRIEERMQIDEFGDAYLAYQEATSKLIPFIYRAKIQHLVRADTLHPPCRPEGQQEW